MVSYMLTVGEAFISKPHNCAPDVSAAHFLKPQVLTWEIYVLNFKKNKLFFYQMEIICEDTYSIQVVLMGKTSWIYTPTALPVWQMSLSVMKKGW